jgi:hypothetical protein
MMLHIKKDIVLLPDSSYLYICGTVMLIGNGILNTAAFSPGNLIDLATIQDVPDKTSQQVIISRMIASIDGLVNSRMYSVRVKQICRPAGRSGDLAISSLIRLDTTGLGNPTFVCSHSGFADF